MTKHDAFEILSFHSCRNNNVNDPRWEFGFVGRLRPSGGELDENNFIQIMESIRVLRDELTADKIDKNLVYDITGIIHLTRVWCMPKIGGVFNSSVTPQEQEQLLQWVEIIENTLFYLLDGADDEIAFRDYECYLQENSDLIMKAELLRMI